MKSTSYSNPSSHGTALDGFTLIELLVTVAVVGILAALLFPALRNSQLRAKSVQCAGNLRSIGIAVQEYAADHEALFPGPVGWSQDSLIAIGNEDLGAFLAPYLGAPPLTSTKQRIAQFLCPSAPQSEEYSYVACHSILNTSTEISPWGDIYATGTTEGQNGKPMKMPAVFSMISPSKEWAIAERFGTAPQGSIYVTSAGPSRHINTNILFFDWHVEPQQ
jgi:prepilin-type N-terminal cleavage/methylation domain-containing protein/prepilin-type processing-associated H-X9-DG protein